MKTLYNFFVITTLLIAFNTTAQSEVAHINSQELISIMPEMIKANKEYEAFRKTLEADIQVLVTAYKKEIEQYRNSTAGQNEGIVEVRNKEIKELQSKIQQARSVAVKQSDQKYLDLTNPIKQNAFALIKKVARANGFKYVFDSSPGNNLLLIDGTDLIDAVKQELGIN